MPGSTDMSNKRKLAIVSAIAGLIIIATAQINNPGGTGNGSVTSIATTAPLGGGPITTTGTLTCSTCAIGPGTSAANHAANFSGVDGVTLADSKVTLTPPATGSTLTIVDGKTVTLNNSITLAGTDGQTYTFPSGSGNVVTVAQAQNLTSKTLTSPVLATLVTDTSIGSNTSAMGAQSSATCTNITGMTWSIAASKNYRLQCMIPRTLAASATLAYCIGGPGTPTSYTISVKGLNGASSAFSQIDLLANATYGTKTTASSANANNAVDEIVAFIQNGSTASGTALTLQTAANGTNNITVGANAWCDLKQVN